jgi:hypothetical protein
MLKPNRPASRSEGGQTDRAGRDAPLFNNRADHGDAYSALWQLANKIDRELRFARRQYRTIPAPFHSWSCSCGFTSQRALLRLRSLSPIYLS